MQYISLKFQEYGFFLKIYISNFNQSKKRFFAVCFRKNCCLFIEVKDYYSTRDLKGKIMGLFSISEEDCHYFNDSEGFIEMESCPIEATICIEPLALINEKMRISRTHLLDKNYLQAIEELKIAYHKTTELNQDSCLQCAKLFRSTITKSMEAIHEDLQKMTTGFFKAKRFNSSLELAASVLTEFKQGI